jgi:hypothetical protein
MPGSDFLLSKMTSWKDTLTMPITKRICFLLLGASLLATYPVYGNKPVLETPVKDQALRKRLRLVKVYKTTQEENLETLAHLLYGHKTWWPRIKKMNSGLARLSQKTPIKKGTRINFLAPKIGSEYVVQKNDWLIRIAIWKYGDTEIWKDIYEKNLRKISHPNLIRPGDRIFLGKRGGIQVAKAKHPGKKVVLMPEPTKIPIQSETLAVAVAIPSPSPVSLLSPEPSPVAVLQDVRAETKFNWWRVALIGLGVVLSICTVLVVRATMIRKSKVSIWTREENVQPAGRVVERPDDGYNVDRSMIADEQVELDQRPDYHAIRQAGWKFYRKIICKFNFFDRKQK